MTSEMRRRDADVSAGHDVDRLGGLVDSSVGEDHGENRFLARLYASLHRTGETASSLAPSAHTGDLGGAGNRGGAVHAVLIDRLTANGLHAGVVSSIVAAASAAALAAASCANLMLSFTGQGVANTLFTHC